VYKRQVIFHTIFDNIHITTFRVLRYADIQHVAEA